MNTREAFTSKSIAVMMIKYSYEFNPCGVNNTMINSSTIGNKHPRCSAVES